MTSSLLQEQELLVGELRKLRKDARQASLWRLQREEMERKATELREGIARLAAEAASVLRNREKDVQVRLCVTQLRGVLLSPRLHGSSRSLSRAGDRATAARDAKASGGRSRS